MQAVGGNSDSRPSRFGDRSYKPSVHNCPKLSGAEYINLFWECWFVVLQFNPRSHTIKRTDSERSTERIVKEQLTDRSSRSRDPIVDPDRDP